jgi:hypothetical protein
MIDAGHTPFHATSPSAFRRRTILRQYFGYCGAVLSIRYGADIVSDDSNDIQRLLSVARVKVSILDT